MVEAMLVIVTVVVSSPIVTAVLVSVASRSEDFAWTLGEGAPGLVQAVARRIVDFHCEAIELPRPRVRALPRSGEGASRCGIVFGRTEADAPPANTQVTAS
jgi:hypothetical protein